MPMIHRFVLSLVALAAWGLVSAPGDARAEERTRPNILLILTDDLGYGDLGSYGATDLETPHIDDLVSRGIRLDQFYANSPVCSPTRAALLTGRYPELVGVPGVVRTHPEDSWGHLSRDAVLLPELLGRAGYHTALVGKWHLGLEAPNRPGDRGFDHVHGFLGDMMDDYYDHRRHGINYMRRGEVEIDPEGHATDLFSEWASDYLRSREGTRAPFFLYLAYNAPHTPIQPPPDWLDRVRRREPGIPEKRAKLVALIEHMDEGIGRVLAALRETRLDDKTLVVFTSDNGGQVNVGANNGPLRAGKGTMYEGGLKVPFAAAWPRHVAPRSRSDRIGLTMDLFPTLLEAAGVSFTHPVDGRSLLPTLLGRGQPPEDRDLFFHRREGNPRFQGLTIAALRRGDWKLVRNSPFGPLELYNLADDPLEERDLAPSHADEFRELAAALRLQVQRGGAVPWQPATRRDAP
jgi:arylsulfatase A-like enzyme